MPRFRDRWGDVIDTRRLSREREMELLRQWKDGDTDAGAELMFHHIRFTFPIARTYWRNGLDLDELVCVGMTGIARAMEKFDESIGTRLSTYAVWWIRAAIGDWVIKNRHVISTGLPYSSSTAPLFWEQMRQLSLNGVDPESPEGILHMANAMCKSENVVRGAINFMGNGREASMNKEVTSEDGAPIEFGSLIRSHDDSPEVKAAESDEREKLREALDEAISRLSPMEQEIVRRYLVDEDTPTLASMGKRYHFSRERARQIEAKAFGKMRRYLGDGMVMTVRGMT